MEIRDFRFLSLFAIVTKPSHDSLSQNMKILLFFCFLQNRITHVTQIK